MDPPEWSDWSVAEQAASKSGSSGTGDIGTRCSDSMSPPLPPEVQAGDQLAGDKAIQERQLKWLPVTGGRGGHGVRVRVTELVEPVLVL